MCAAGLFGEMEDAAFHAKADFIESASPAGAPTTMQFSRRAPLVTTAKGSYFILPR